MTCVGAQPGWFEDSFPLKLGLPGSAGSVPTVLHDAADTGTDYIMGGAKGAKIIPRELKFNKNEPSQVGWDFIFIGLWPSLKRGPRMPK